MDRYWCGTYRKQRRCLPRSRYGSYLRGTRGAHFLDIDPRAALDAIGLLPDDEIDLADAALQLARLATPRVDWRAAQAHLSEIAREAASIPTASDDVIAQARTLADMLARARGYCGDEDTYDDFANANLIQVIERRRGLPVALGILWLHAAHAAGWNAAGVNLPRHFVVALRRPGSTLVLDPFRGGVALDASNLPDDLLTPMRRREVLLRLQNNIRLRLMHGGDLAGAAGTARDMLRLAPDAVALWLETGLLYARIDEPEEATSCLERVLELAPGTEAAQRALAHLQAAGGGGKTFDGEPRRDA